MTEDLAQLSADAVAASPAPSDPDHPLFHVAPPVGRLNDPNGLIRVGDTYHAFFQFSPLHPRKLVYWGHATSKDLTTWDYHPAAIIPDSRYDRNGAYSGTAIATADGVELWYTGNYKDPETGEREATQCVVTTPDMASFTKDPANPIVPVQPNGYTAHFRDPQVWWDPRTADHEDGPYRMLIGVQRDNLTGAALLYRSKDLREWTLEGEMTFPDANGAFDNFGYMWECPNLVRVQDQVTGQWRDVLIFCPQGIEPDREGFENIFPCIYIVGDLDGTAFRGATGEFDEVDRGFEFYAPQIFAHGLVPPVDPADIGAPLLVGWAGNASEDDQPSIGTGNWVHTLTVARELSLRDGRLYQKPVLAGLPVAASTLTGITLDEGAVSVPELDGSRSWRLDLKVSGGNWEIVIGDKRRLTLSFADGTLIVDRSTSRYPHGETRHITVDSQMECQVTILHDRSVTELFLGDGKLAFTCRSFLDVEETGVRIRAKERLELVDVKAARMD